MEGGPSCPRRGDPAPGREVPGRLRPLLCGGPEPRRSRARTRPEGGDRIEPACRGEETPSGTAGLPRHHPDRRAGRRSPGPGRRAGGRFRRPWRQGREGGAGLCHRGRDRRQCTLAAGRRNRQRGNEDHARDPAEDRRRSCSPPRRRGATALPGHRTLTPEPPGATQEGGRKPETNVPERPKTDEQDKPATDRYGDPLPRGAAGSPGGLCASAPASSITRFAFAPDGKALALRSSATALVCLWDPDTGKELRRLLGQTSAGVEIGWVTSIAFSPNGVLAAPGTPMGKTTSAFGRWARGKNSCASRRMDVRTSMRPLSPLTERFWRREATTGRSLSGMRQRPICSGGPPIKVPSVLSRSVRTARPSRRGERAE